MGYSHFFIYAHFGLYLLSFFPHLSPTFHLCHSHSHILFSFPVFFPIPGPRHLFPLGGPCRCSGHFVGRGRRSFGACSLPQPRGRFSIPGPTLHHNVWGIIHPCMFCEYIKTNLQFHVSIFPTFLLTHSHFFNAATLHQTPDDWFQAKKRVELTSIDAYFYLLYHVLYNLIMTCICATIIPIMSVN